MLVVPLPSLRHDEGDSCPRRFQISAICFGNTQVRQSLGRKFETETYKGYNRRLFGPPSPYSGERVNSPDAATRSQGTILHYPLPLRRRRREYDRLRSQTQSPLLGRNRYSQYRRVQIIRTQRWYLYFASSSYYCGEDDESNTCLSLWRRRKARSYRIIRFLSTPQHIKRFRDNHLREQRDVSS